MGSQKHLHVTSSQPQEWHTGVMWSKGLVNSLGKEKGQDFHLKKIPDTQFIATQTKYLCGLGEVWFSYYNKQQARCT